MAASNDRGKVYLISVVFGRPRLKPNRLVVVIDAAKPSIHHRPALCRWAMPRRANARRGRGVPPDLAGFNITQLDKNSLVWLGFVSKNHMAGRLGARMAGPAHTWRGRKLAGRIRFRAEGVSAVDWRRLLPSAFLAGRRHARGPLFRGCFVAETNNTTDTG
jgi:hypothetical protein